MNLKISLALVTASSLVLAGTPLPAATVVNRTIATVNGEAVLLSEFDKNFNSFLEQQKNMLPAEQLTPEWEKETKKKILEQMIDDKILLQEAKKRKVRVSQRELEGGVIQIKARFLPDAGRRELDALVQKALANRPPDDQTPADINSIDLAGLWQELSKSKPDAVKESESKFKEELVKEGITEKKFQDRIRDQLSVVQLTQQEVRGRTKPPADEAAKELFEKINQVMQGKEVKNLDPEDEADLESMSKFFAAQTGERVKARHILLRVDKDASFKDKSAARRKLADLRAKIVAGADFSEMAQKFSDDKGSAVRGGDLGAFMRGQMVPPFEKAAFSLPVGQVSDIVETDFGFHLILVDEKRAAAKLRYEDVEDDLKEYLFRVNAQKTFEEYVQQLRKTASIKVLIDFDEAPKK
ncbi:MAG TPA: peptidylprolyl isomerase [Elusimicrobiota bacterium]|nr:peptidylprolyl isomerase [Elusimicrobiota bacterium]